MEESHWWRTCAGGTPGLGTESPRESPRVCWVPLHLAKELEGQNMDPDSLGKMEHLEKRHKLRTAQTLASILHTKVLKNVQKHKSTVIAFITMQTQDWFLKWLIKWAKFKHTAWHWENPVGYLMKLLRSRTPGSSKQRDQVGQRCYPLSWLLLHLCFSNRFLCQKHWFSCLRAH